MREQRWAARLGLVLGLALAAAEAQAWSVTDVLPQPNYSDEFSPPPSLPQGEALRVQEIKYPVQGMPSLLRPGDELRLVVDVDQDPASANLAIVGLRLRSHRPQLQKVIDLTSAATVAEDPANGLFLVTAPLPATDVPYDVYDVELEASTGPASGDCASPPAGFYCDSQSRAVKVLDRFRDTFTFVQLSDVHQDDPRGTTDNHYRQDVIDGIIKTLNFLQPEFVVISGDLAYGERYFQELPNAMRTFDQARFPTFTVPGNHDAQRNVLGLGLNDGYDYYRGFWGPPYYSFDYGAFHLVGLSSMERPREDREIGVSSEGKLLAEFWGGIDLHDSNGGTIPHPQLDWLEADLDKAAAAEKQSVFYLHHDPTKDYTPGFKSHDVWNFDDMEYGESSDRLRGLLSSHHVGFMLVGHDHYDEAREVLGTKILMTTTAASERRFGAYWGYRLFRVKDDAVVSYGYRTPSASVPYGFPQDPQKPDALTPYVDTSFAGANDGTGVGETATVRNLLAEDMTGRLEFFVSGADNQASRGKILQESAVSGAVRVLVEVTAPAGQTLQVELRPASTRPTQPGSLTASVTQSSIRVHWSPVPETDIRGYRVYLEDARRGTRSLAAELKLEDLADPQHPDHEILGLSVGGRYIVGVTAFDAALESPQKSSGVLTVHKPPEAPVDLEAAAGSQFVDLGFTQPGAAASWLLYYGSGPGTEMHGTDAAEGASPIAVSSTRIRLSGLKNGTAYRLAVSALDLSGGESPLSEVVTVLPTGFASADLDGNGQLDPADRSTLLRMQASLAAIDGNVHAVADLNGNQRLDLGDAVLADALLSGGNTPPLVRVQASPTTLAAGRPVTIDASGTVDRQELPGALQFRFDFQGDGTFTPWGSSAKAAHTYPDDAPRLVVVEAKDSTGLVGRALARLLPKIATHLFLIDIDGCRRDVMYRWISGSGSGHRSIRDDLLGRITYGGDNGDDADFSKSSALGSNYCRSLFPTVTFTNQAAIPTGQHARTHGIAGNEFFDRDLLFERSFVSGDAQAVYTEGKALATMWPAARTIYQDGHRHGLESTVIFHQYPKEADSYVSQNTPEFGAFLLDPAQKYDQLSFYRSVEQLLATGFPPIAYLYLAGLDHRSHLEGIESQDDQLSVIDTFFEKFVHGGTFDYPKLTVPGSAPGPIAFAGLENLPDPLTEDPNDTLLDNSVFCFTADHGQINYGDDAVDVSNIAVAVQQYFDPEAVVEGEPPVDEPVGGRGAQFEIRTGLKDSETLDKATVVAEFNGPSMLLYVKNRARGTWAGYPDFEKDVLPLARAMARANTDGRTDNIRDGAVRDIVVRRTGKSGDHEYSEGYVAYRWNGSTDEVIELEDYFSPQLIHTTNIIEHLRKMESRRSGDIILTPGRDPGAADTEPTGWNYGLPIGSILKGQHGDWTAGEALIPQVCGGLPVKRLGLQRTEPLTSQVDFAPTAAQFLGISMDAAEGRGYLYPPQAEPVRFPQVTASLGNGTTPAGDTVALALRVQGGQGLRALRATLRFDAKRLTLLPQAASVTSTSLLDTAIRAGIGTGEIALLFDPLISDDLAIASLRFRVSASASGTIPVSLAQIEISDASGLVQPASGSGGSIVVTGRPPVPLRLEVFWAVAWMVLAFAAWRLRARRLAGLGLLALICRPWDAAAHGPGRMGNALGQEMIVDAPWRVTSSIVPILIGAHDANVGLRGIIRAVRVFELGDGAEQLIYENKSPQQGPSNSWFNTDDGSPYLVEADRLQEPGDVTELKVEVDWDLVSLASFTFTQHLYVRRGWPSNGEPLPSLPNWFPGDVHYHTEFTGDRDSGLTNEVTEFGGPIGFLPWACSSVGLRWLTTTDHALYITEERWRDLQSSIARAMSLNAPGPAQLLRGEEASPYDMIANDSGLTLHSLIYGHSKFVTADEVHPSTNLAGMLAQVSVQPGAFSYGAHPFNGLDLGGAHLWSAWTPEDYAAAFEDPAQPAMKGLQIWNVRTAKTGVDLPPRSSLQPFPATIAPGKDWVYSPSPSTLRELLQGLVKWDELLMRSLATANAKGAVPRQIFATGGSDAHGDCNYTVSYFGDYHASEGAIGKPLTYIQIPSGRVSEGTVLEALRNGRAVMSDGPLAILAVDLNANGAIDPGDVQIGEAQALRPTAVSSLKLVVRFESTPEFGPIERLRLLRGEDGLAKKRPRAVIPGKTALQPSEDFIVLDPPQMSGSISIPLQPYLPNDRDWYYFRLEAYSHVGDPVDQKLQPVKITFQDGTSSPAFPMDDWWTNTQQHHGETYRCYTNPIWLKSDAAAPLPVPSGDLVFVGILAVAAGAWLVRLRRVPAS